MDTSTRYIVAIDAENRTEDFSALAQRLRRLLKLLEDAYRAEDRGVVMDAADLLSVLDCNSEELDVALNELRCGHIVRDQNKN